MRSLQKEQELVLYASTRRTILTKTQRINSSKKRRIKNLDLSTKLKIEKTPIIVLVTNSLNNYLFILCKLIYIRYKIIFNIAGLVFEVYVANAPQHQTYARLMINT